MVDVKELNSKKGSISSADMRKQVMKARRRQEERFLGTGLCFNSDISSKEIMKYCNLGKKETAYMEKVFYRMNLSARSYHKILKVARTIADLDDGKQIRMEHLAEAVCYRAREGVSIDAG